MPIYVKYDQINGEVKASGYEQWVEVDSFSWGITNPITTGSSGGQTVGRASFQDIHLEAVTNASSPQLLSSASEGKVINSVEIDFVKPQASQAYLKIMLSDVFVSSYQFGGSEGANADTPSESISLNFTKVELDYQPANPDGTLAPPLRFVGPLTTAA